MNKIIIAITLACLLVIGNFRVCFLDVFFEKVINLTLNKGTTNALVCVRCNVGSSSCDPTVTETCSPGQQCLVS